MNPSVKDRLGSVVRALNGVVLPALPKEASLAQEQVMLAMGHIQIILAQMDAEPDFLAEEAADLAAMGEAITAVAQGGSKTAIANATLKDVLATTNANAADVRVAAIQQAIDTVLVALAEEGDQVVRKAVDAVVLGHGARRADKDRKWFAAMGFDIDYSGG
jgi:hypothetical protein